MTLTTSCVGCVALLCPHWPIPTPGRCAERGVQQIFLYTHIFAKSYDLPHDVIIGKLRPLSSSLIIHKISKSSTLSLAAYITRGHIITRPLCLPPSPPPLAPHNNLFKGLEEPSVAVRCSPVLYKIVPAGSGETDEPILEAKYRMVFAVLTISAVYIYDTQHSYPIARLAGLHFACINVSFWRTRVFPPPLLAAGSMYYK